MFNAKPEDGERLTRGTGLVSLEAIETNVVPITAATGNRQARKAAQAEAQRAAKRGRR